MDFRLNEEQQMLQDTVARLVRGEYSFEKRLEFSESELGFSADFWKQLGELGITAVPFPEELGGFGGSVAEWLGNRSIKRPRLERIGASDEFIHETCEQESAMEKFGLTGKAIADRVRAAV